MNSILAYTTTGLIFFIFQASGGKHETSLNCAPPIARDSCSVLASQLFTSVSVKVVVIYLTALQLSKYPPLFTSILVNDC